MPSPSSPALVRRRAPRRKPATTPAAAAELLSLKPPSPWLMMLESRAPWEWAASLASLAVLARAPRGDGHPVIVFPGLVANDLTTAPLRQYLAWLGHASYPWSLGVNLGPREGVLEQCREIIHDLHARHGERVSLIGWSLGGIYARELAKELPELTRCVITLGTPFSGHPRATNAWRLYRYVSGHDPISDESFRHLREPPPVPTTSLYSRTDGVVSWRCSLNPRVRHAENIEIIASHIGMGMNPLALYAIADRLAQRPESWRRFDADGAWRYFYGRSRHDAPGGAD